MNPLDEFLKMKKEAGWLSETAKAVGGHIMEGAKRAIGPVAVGLGVGAGIAGAEKGIGAIREHFGKQRDYQAMLEANPAVQKMDAGRVQMLYNTLRKTAPTLASDPIIAGSFIHKTIDVGGAPYVDTQTVKMLTDAQKSIATARGGGGMREFAMGTAGGAAISGLPKPGRD